MLRLVTVWLMMGWGWSLQSLSADWRRLEPGPVWSSAALLAWTRLLQTNTVSAGRVQQTPPHCTMGCQGRNAGKTVFWVFLTMHYLKSPICFLISISRKLKSPSGMLHCRKQLMSEEKWGKLKVPRFSGKTGGIHTFSKYRWLFTYHNSPGKANELQNEIILKEKRCHKGLRQQP